MSSAPEDGRTHEAPATPHLARHAAPGTPHEVPESDTPMTATYVRVLVFEAAIIIALWFFGRTFS